MVHSKGFVVNRKRYIMLFVMTVRILPVSSVRGGPYIRNVGERGGHVTRRSWDSHFSEASISRACSPQVRRTRRLFDT